MLINEHAHSKTGISQNVDTHRRSPKPHQISHKHPGPRTTHWLFLLIVASLYGKMSEFHIPMNRIKRIYVYLYLLYPPIQSHSSRLSCNSRPLWSLLLLQYNTFPLSINHLTYSVSENTIYFIPVHYSTTISKYFI